MPSFDFPSDLVEASRACKNLSEQIAAFPSRPAVLSDGTVFREGTVYTVEMSSELARLEAERLEQATFVVTHAFWSSVEPGDRLVARSALKHVGVGAG